MQRLIRILAAAGLGAAIVLGGVQMWAASRLPLPSYDGRVIWEFKSKILFQRGTRAAELKESDLLIPHADYPALVPLAAVELASEFGGWSPAFLAGLGVAAYAVCGFLLWRQTGDSGTAKLAVLAWAFLPSHHLIYESCLRSGTADLVVGMFILASASCAIKPGGRPHPLVIAVGAAFIGLATAAKFDGLMWAIAFIPVGFALGAGDREWLSRGLQIMAACGLVVVAVAAPWLRMTLNWNSGQTEPYFYRFVTGAGFFDFGRWFHHAGQVFAELLLRPDRSSLPVWVAILSGGYAWRRGVLDPMARAFFAAAAMFVLCVLGAYQVSPWPTGEQVTASFYRLLIQAAPILTLASVMCIRALEGETESVKPAADAQGAPAGAARQPDAASV